MLLTTVLLWAFNLTVTRYVLTHGFRPLAYSLVRYGAAAAIFSGLTYRREGSFAVRRREVALLLGAAALGVWLNQIGFVYAVKLTNASTTALILGITPIFTALIAGVVGLERVSARFALAGLASFAGVALVALGRPGSLSTSAKGDLLVVGTAATWAAYSVAVAPLMRSYSPFRISAIVLLAGYLPLFATGARQVLGQDFSLDPLVWLGLAYAILGPLVLTNVLWFTAIDRVGPSRATLFANLQPFVAAVFALLILSEQMSWLQVGGGVLIAGGIVLARQRQIPPEPPAD